MTTTVESRSSVRVGQLAFWSCADHFAYEDASALERIFHGLLWETF